MNTEQQKKTGCHFMKKVYFVLGAIIFCFLIVEIFSGYLFWIRKFKVSGTRYLLNRIYSRLILGPQRAMEVAHVSFSPKSMYVPDAYLGFTSIPGSYTVALKNKSETSKYHSFTVTIDEHGHRITSFAPELFEGKMEIWIFGDSFTFGWGNNDETTSPFFLQQLLPNFRVVNYADIGYGNVHAYLQIKREFEKKATRPAMIVVVYGNYFNVRNVAAPSRLKKYRYNDSLWEMNPSSFLHPRASVSGGKLEIEYVPLFWEFNKDSSEGDPSKEYQYEVTKKILNEIYRMGSGNGARLILAFISGNDSDEVISYARQTGYFISDLRPKGDGRLEWDNFSPLDIHPGPLAQNIYARKLYKTISGIRSNTEL